MIDELRTDAWDRSYDRHENFLYYPHEEVVRFMARHVRKRVGYDDFQDRHAAGRNPVILDLGCGIGRHVRFCDDLKLDAWGIDHSSVAVDEARGICEREGRSHLVERFKVGNIAALPFADEQFDFIVSHGVLDSVPFALAEQAMEECRRVLTPAGRFYLDLISGDDDRHFREYAGEEVVSTEHERDTIQSYFNYSLIELLVRGRFSIEECLLVTRTSVISRDRQSRYHIILATP